MNRLIETLKIKRQTTYWIWFGRISPILFLFGAFTLYEIFNTEIPLLFYASWAIFITVSLIWWGWVLKIILEFIKFFQEVSHSVNDIQSDVKEVQKNVKELTQSNPKQRTRQSK